MAKITLKNNVRKFQDGGAVAPEQAAAAPAEQAAPVEQGGGAEAQVQQALEMLAQAVQTQNGNLALQAGAMLLQALGAGQQGGGEQPMSARNGGVIFRRDKSGRLCR